MEPNKKYTGEVKFYNQTWQYGMIIPDDKSLVEAQYKKDIMAHATALLDPIQKYDKVEFELKEKEGKGLRAINVKLIKHASN